MENSNGRHDRLPDVLTVSHVASGDVERASAASTFRSGGSMQDPLGPVRMIARRWRLLLAIVACGALLGASSNVVAAEANPAVVPVDHYEARHVLVLDNNVPLTQSTLSVRNLNALAKRVTIGEIPQTVADSVGISPTEAETQIRVLIRSDSESLDLVAIGEMREEAEALADTYAAALLSWLDAQATDYAAGAIAAAQDRLDEAEANLEAVRSEIVTAEARGDTALVTELRQDEQQFISARIAANAAVLDARSDGIPIVPLESLQYGEGNAITISQDRFVGLVDDASNGRNIEALFGDDVESIPGAGALSAVGSSLPTGMLARVLTGALLGLSVGVMAMVVAARLDNRVRSKRQVEDLLDLPVIAEVPALDRKYRDAAEVHAQEYPRSRFAEQYRAVASTLSYARRSRRSTGQVMLVTSPGPSEGKTTTVANLGAMLAEAGHRVLLVNCDFRRPRLHVLTGTEYEPMDLSPTEIPDVELISNVVDDVEALPTEVIAAQRSVIRKAMSVYDLVLIDTAPLLATNDAVELLDLVDDVVLVMRAGKTTLQAADRAAEILERRRAHVLGVCLLYTSPSPRDKRQSRMPSSA